MDHSKTAEAGNKTGHDRADGGPAPERRSRLVERLKQRWIAWLDGTIGVLGKWRSRAEASSGDEHDHAIPPPVVLVAKPYGRLRAFLIATATLLLGLIAGAGFSFKLFAHQLDIKDEKIFYQADALLDQQKDVTRAERALEKVKDELKETLHDLDLADAETSQVKKQLIDVDARLNLCNNRVGTAGGGASGGALPSPPQAARGMRQGSKSGNCELSAGGANRNLGKCLEQFNR